MTRPQTQDVMFIKVTQDMLNQSVVLGCHECVLLFVSAVHDDIMI